MISCGMEGAAQMWELVVSPNPQKEIIEAETAQLAIVAWSTNFSAMYLQAASREASQMFSALMVWLSHSCVQNDQNLS